MKKGPSEEEAVASGLCNERVAKSLESGQRVVQRHQVRLKWLPASAAFRYSKNCSSLNRFFFMPVFSFENGLY